MNAYFFKMSKEEKSNILDQHKSLYDGYVTKYNQESNQSPLYVQDFANDKNGITLNNKGEVKPYTNFKINESHTGLDMIGGDPHDQSEYKYRHLKNGTVDIDSVEDTNEDNVEFMHDVLPSPNEDEFDYETFGKFANEMKNNDDQYEYDIDKLEDYSAEQMNDDEDEDDVEFEGDGENSEIGTEEELNFDWLNSYQDDVDDEDLPNVVSSITESLDMFKRFKKYN
jgi:hypothetical protein